jgi:uncharacterized repeat protein (TIGR01451 family)
VGVGFAQSPQGPWLVLDTVVAPEEVAVNEGFLTTLTLRNEGTDAATVDAVTVELPAGVVYVGPAFGSDVVDAAEGTQAQLRWTGPFAVPAGAELTIRYWSVTTGRTSPGPYVVKASAMSGDEILSAAESSLVVSAGAARQAPSDQPTRVEMAPLPPGEVQVSKMADTNPVTPGSGLAYMVTFTNTGSSDVTLDKIADSLPSPFVYVGLGTDSQVDEEPDQSAAPDIVWDEWDQDPPVVPAGGTLILHYVVWVPHEMLSSPGPYTNAITAYSGDTAIASTHVDVMLEDFTTYMPLVFRDYTFPYFTMTKSASPDRLTEGDPPAERVVEYTVTLSNGGDDPGVLSTIEDTLPPGFTFLGMAPGSDVDVGDPDDDTEPEIVWTGPFTVAARSDLTLIYRAQAPDVVGKYLNTVRVTTLVGRAPEAPAGATVILKPPILLQDNFDSNADQWTLFLNNRRLDPSQWWWEANVGVEGGAFSHSMYAWPKREAHDALAMYLGPGQEAESWTNYRFETSVLHLRHPTNPVRETQLAIWFRGNYEDSEIDNQWVLGYYLGIYPLSNRITLWQTQTEDDCIEDTCWVYEWQYNYQNPVALAEVQYPLGKSWFEQWHKLAVEVRGDASSGGAQIKGFVDDELVIEYTDTEGTIIGSGAVGLATYKTYLIRWDNVLVTPLD